MNLRQIVYLTLGALPLGVAAQTSPLPGGLPMSGAGAMSAKERTSYAIGMYFASNITNSIKHTDMDVDMNVVQDAIKTVLDGQKPKLTDADVNAVLRQIRSSMAATAQLKRKEEEEANRKKGEMFLEDFAKQPGVTKLPNGVEYKVLKEGSGPLPKGNDSVTVAYRGMLVDGTEFDHRDDFSTSLHGGIISGWQEVLPLMKVGSKWKVALPYNMAYGLRGRPPKIPGSAALIFDMELKGIAPGAPTLPPFTPASPPTSQLYPRPGASAPMVSQEIIKVPSADELKKGAKIEVIKAGQTNAVSASQ